MSTSATQRDRAEHASRYKDSQRQGIEPGARSTGTSLGPGLVEAAIRRGEGHLASADRSPRITSPHTGRSPKDKFVVRDGASAADVDWGAVNQPLDPQHFDVLLR